MDCKEDDLSVYGKSYKDSEGCRFDETEFF